MKLFIVFVDVLLMFLLVMINGFRTTIKSESINIIQNHKTTFCVNVYQLQSKYKARQIGRF